MLYFSAGLRTKSSWQHLFLVDPTAVAQSSPSRLTSHPRKLVVRSAHTPSSRDTTPPIPNQECRWFFYARPPWRCVAQYPHAWTRSVPTWAAYLADYSYTEFLHSEYTARKFSHVALNRSRVVERDFVSPLALRLGMESHQQHTDTVPRTLVEEGYFAS